MFPTLDQTTAREAIKRDFNDLDSLISEPNQPKEVIQPTDKKPYPDEYPATGEHSIPGEPISPEIAALSGKMIAGTIDTALATGMSLYAHNSNPEKYQAKEKQIEQLNEAWAAVAAKYNYKLEDSPWFNVIILTIAVYLPLWQEAKKDRRFAEVNERIDELKAEYDRLSKTVDDLKTAQKAVV